MCREKFLQIVVLFLATSYETLLAFIIFNPSCFIISYVSHMPQLFQNTITCNRNERKDEVREDSLFMLISAKNLKLHVLIMRKRFLIILIKSVCYYTTQSNEQKHKRRLEITIKISSLFKRYKEQYSLFKG